MSTSTNRNLLVIIAVLVLTNIAVLVYFLALKKPEKTAAAATDSQRNAVAEMLQKEVGFTDEQTAKYKEMKEKQRERIRPMFDDMRKAKDSLFRLLSFPETTDSVLDRVTDNIARRQKAIDIETFNHFKRVRTLCTPDQQPRYDSMVVRMFRKMGRQPHRNDGDKGDHKH